MTDEGSRRRPDEAERGGNAPRPPSASHPIPLRGRGPLAGSAPLGGATFSRKREKEKPSVPFVIAPVADLLIALRFFSRLPVPTTAREQALGAGGLAKVTAVVPLAGAIIGIFPASMLVVADALRLPPLVAGALAIAALVAVTGALHEDALADCADGFGGGATRARKLEIMRDSRIGAYGACALAVSLLIRAAALGAIAGNSGWLGAAAAVAAAALSRMASLLPLMILPPARADGVGASAARPSTAAFAIGTALAVAVAAAALSSFAAPARIAAAVVLTGLVALGLCALAHRQIGGHTGDVAGAAQQLAEMVVYLVLAAG